MHSPMIKMTLDSKNSSSFDKFVSVPSSTFSKFSQEVRKTFNITGGFHIVASHCGAINHIQSLKDLDKFKDCSDSTKTLKVVLQPGATASIPGPGVKYPWNYKPPVGGCIKPTTTVVTSPFVKPIHSVEPVVRYPVVLEVSKVYEKSPYPPNVHVSISCDSCKVSPIIGNRYKSLTKADFDLCEKCRYKNQYRDVTFIQIPNYSPKEQDQVYSKPSFVPVLQHFKGRIAE